MEGWVGKTFGLDAHPLRKRMLIERMGRQMTVNQLGIDPAERVYMQEADIQALLMLPMVFQDRIVGLVEMTDSQNERVFTDQEISMAQLLANQTAIAIENARLYRRSQQEIDERMRAEEQIKTSLEEKVVLLKEIHHRVKNNLQVISSLLNLQSQSIRDREALEIFKESQNRIRSMALIHEKLYRSHDLAKINFAEYVRSLASFLVRSYRAQAGPVGLKVQADDVALSIDAAVPCGLIVNELVSNALKYAFPDGREGEIRVVLQPDHDQHMTLVVGDNGVGFPDDVDFRDTESLGMQLVNTLVEQLDGTIELHKEGGTEFEIVFASS
jgi:two-component sensor histidine kinase